MARKGKQISGQPPEFCFNWKYWNKMFQPCSLLVLMCICSFVLSWDEQQPLKEQESLLKGASSISFQQCWQFKPWNTHGGESPFLMIKIDLVYSVFVTDNKDTQRFLPWEGKMREPTCLWSGVDIFISSNQTADIKSWPSPERTHFLAEWLLLVQLFNK